MTKKKKNKLEDDNPTQESLDTAASKQALDIQQSEEDETLPDSDDATDEDELASDYETRYEELNDRFLRLVAEYENFRKRTQKEKNSLYNNSVIDVCKAWLPVLDNLDRAIDAANKLESEESKKMAEGVEMVRRQALETMSSLGVECMDCMGEKFDPTYHEAIAHVEDDSYGEEEIIDIIQKGYIKGDRVIRHCMVRVAN